MTTKRTNRNSKARRVSHVLAKGKGVVGARRRKTVTDAINFEALENRQLMSVVNVADFGAKVNDGQDDRAAIQQAINTAKAGDTIAFGAGQYDLNGTLDVQSDRTLLGAANHSSKLVFKTANNAFAMQLKGASNITINGLAIKANDGGIVAWSDTSNVKIINNDFVWGYDGTYYNRLGIRAAGANKGMIIEHNNFHDSQSSDRNVDLYNMTDSSYSYNTFSNVHDGGHVDGTTTNFKFVGNVGKGIQRMGLELQDHNSTTSNNILVADNVFTDWRAPDNWSFGLSIIPQRAHNVTVRNNYLSAGHDALSGGTHLGYGIESGFQSGILEGNILIGSWVQAITCSIKNTQLRNNQSYGSNQWGAWGGEPGLDGNGSVNDLGGNKSGMAESQAPPPKFAIEGENTISGGITNLAAKVMSDTSVKLAWKNDQIAPTSVRIDVIATVSRETVKSVTLSGAAATATITGLPAGWQLDFTVTAITANGEVSANPVSVKMTGATAQGSDTISGTTDLTTMKMESSSNGWGSYELNHSNGEDASGDGQAISIGGTKYIKGFGVHAPSALVFKVGARYRSFAAVIGLDDEATGGSVVFRVYGDGKKLFDSGLMTSEDAARKINVNIAGVKKLKLVVVSPDGNIDSDHADWANPLLVNGSGTAQGSTPTKPKRYMQHMRLTSTVNKLGAAGVNESIDGNTQTINGQTFNKGVGVTAASKLVYALNGKYKTFCSYIGMDDETESKGTVTFQVWGDGKLLYDSGTVNNTSHLRKVKVNVQGMNQLWLVVTPAHGGVSNASVHADWAQSYMLAA